MEKDTFFWCCNTAVCSHTRQDVSDVTVVQSMWFDDSVVMSSGCFAGRDVETAVSTSGVSTFLRGSVRLALAGVERVGLREYMRIQDGGGR